MAFNWEWDPNKAQANLQKHGVSFEEGTTVFGDPLAGTFHDPRHSDSEDRFNTVGRSSGGRIIVVAHVERGDNIRIISARQAVPKEVRVYEESDRS